MEFRQSTPALTGDMGFASPTHHKFPPIITQQPTMFLSVLHFLQQSIIDILGMSTVVLSEYDQWKLWVRFFS